MCLHADGVHDGVRAAAVGHVPDGVAQVVLVLAQVDHLDAAGPHPGQPVGHQVDADHPVALVLADPGREVAHRAQAQHDQGAAVGHLGVLHGLPRGGQDVRQVGEPVVGGALGQLDVGELRLRHPQELGLPAGDGAVHRRVAEQRGARALVAHLGGLALGVQPLVAHPAVPAGDLERDGDPVADPQVAGLAADLDHLAHGLVPHHVAHVHERGEGLDQVQVRAADVRRRHADDRVRGLLDGGVGDLVHPDVALAVPGHCLHRWFLSGRARTAPVVSRPE
ncbi:unannotated protein [freshwater metagenome]|uniref:Unannotated protein n=1 Tax=freshwater metagenome TaxID=449393 RepID=A0A6J7H630_9ZZZZ